jgi:hypothetical protein
MFDIVEKVYLRGEIFRPWKFFVPIIQIVTINIAVMPIIHGSQPSIMRLR